MEPDNAERRKFLKKLLGAGTVTFAATKFGLMNGVTVPSGIDTGEISTAGLMDKAEEFLESKAPGAEYAGELDYVLGDAEAFNQLSVTGNHVTVGIATRPDTDGNITVPSVATRLAFGYLGPETYDSTRETLPSYDPAKTYTNPAPVMTHRFTGMVEGWYRIGVYYEPQPGIDTEATENIPAWMYLDFEVVKQDGEWVANNDWAAFIVNPVSDN